MNITGPQLAFFGTIAVVAIGVPIATAIGRRIERASIVKPSIKTNGLFSEGGHAEIWLSDDPRRLLVQMKTHFSFISLGLYLRKIQGDSMRLSP